MPNNIRIAVNVDDAASQPLRNVGVAASQAGGAINVLGQTAEGAGGKMREFHKTGLELVNVAQLIPGPMGQAASSIGLFMSVSGEFGKIAHGFDDLGKAALHGAANLTSAGVAGAKAALGIGAQATPAITGLARAEDVASASALTLQGRLATLGTSGVLGLLTKFVALGGGVAFAGQMMARENVTFDEAYDKAHKQADAVDNLTGITKAFTTVVAATSDAEHDYAERVNTSNGILGEAGQVTAGYTGTLHELQGGYLGAAGGATELASATQIVEGTTYSLEARTGALIGQLQSAYGFTISEADAALYLARGMNAAAVAAQNAAAGIAAFRAGHPTNTHYGAGTADANVGFNVGSINTTANAFDPEALIQHNLGLGDNFGYNPPKPGKTGGGGGGGHKGSGLAAASQAAAAAAKKLADTIAADEKKAYDTATTEATKHFDKLHAQRMKAIEDSHTQRQAAIDDAHKSATAEVDAERKALNEILDAKRAAAMQPVTDAEKALSADEAAHQRGGLVAAISSAQGSLNSNTDATQVASLQQQLDEANFQLSDFDRRATLDAQRTAAEAVAAGITDQTAVSSGDILAQEAGDKLAAHLAANPGAGLVTNATLDAQQLTADTQQKLLTDQETLRYDHAKELETTRDKNERASFSAALKTSETHLEGILAKAKDQHTAEIEIRDAIHALLTHYGVDIPAAGGATKSTKAAGGTATVTPHPVNVAVTVQGSIADPNSAFVSSLVTMLEPAIIKALRRDGIKTGSANASGDASGGATHSHPIVAAS